MHARLLAVERDHRQRVRPAQEPPHLTPGAQLQAYADVLEREESRARIGGAVGHRACSAVQVGGDPLTPLEFLRPGGIGATPRDLRLDRPCKRLLHRRSAADRQQPAR
jgi:hypothetical protein